MALWIMTVSLAGGFQYLKQRHCFHVTTLMTKVIPIYFYNYGIKILKITKKIISLVPGLTLLINTGKVLFHFRSGNISTTIFLSNQLHHGSEKTIISVDSNTLVE